jgi:hypothetical protein
MNKKEINGIRQYYQIPNKVTNKQIAKNLKGSFVNLDIAKKNLVKAFKEAMPRILKKYFLIQKSFCKLSSCYGEGSPAQSKPRVAQQQQQKYCKWELIDPEKEKKAMEVAKRQGIR